MKRLLIILQLFIITSCKEKKTFNIPNGYGLDYRKGDTLIFLNKSGIEKRLFCKYYGHLFEPDNLSSSKDYFYEVVRTKLFPNDNDEYVFQGIDWQSYNVEIPPRLTDSTSFIIFWDKLNQQSIHSESILGNRYDQVVKVDCNCPNPDRHYIKTDLKKGLLTFFDSTGTLWQFKEKRPKL